jgi:hypothetical protein
MPSTVGSGRILIIASYNGNRHNTRGISPAQMLRIQYSQLNKLKHDLDRVLIVVNEPGSGVDDDYEKALMLFPHQIKTPNTNQGSYGGWRDGFLAYPDHEWYFFLEDDQTFFMDNFDQLWIDLWTPDTSYLATQISEGYNRHASMSSGLIKGEVLREIDWSNLNAEGQYNSSLQVNWSRLFNREGLRGIDHIYGTPFWTGQDLLWVDSSKPTLIGPMQLLA